MNLSPLPIQKFFGNNGRLLVGGKLFTYTAGTNTKVATYTDASGGTPNTNPVILNFRGECSVWLDPTLTYKFVLAPANDTDPPTNPIWTVDNISAGLTIAQFTQSFIGQILWPRTAAEISATVTPSNYGYPPLDAYRYGADGTGGSNDTTAMARVDSVIAQLSGLPWIFNWAMIPPNDVRRYGVKGDGTTDDQPAFLRAVTAWSGKAVYVPTPPVAYKFNSGLSVPDNTAIIGDNKRLCKILAGGNIDLLTLGDGAQLYRVYLEGNATTGHGVVIPSGAGNQTIQNCRIINFDVGAAGGCIHFADNTAGSRISVHDVETWQTNGQSTGQGGTGDKFAIFIPDVFNNSAVPRKFTQIETAGFCSFSLGGCNDLFIGGSFLADVAFSSNSRAVQMYGGRIANQVALVVDGANHSIVGVDTAPQLVLASGLTASKIDPGSLNAGLNTFRTITAITQAASAVVTISTVSGSNPFKVGAYVTFDNVAGMTQINGLNGKVTAIGGASGAWTVTVNINSSGFSAYTSGGNLCAPGIVDNTGGNNSVQVFWQRQIYNPMLSSGGTAPSLGNGTLSGYFSRVGSATFVVINFTVGSTTTLGTGDLRFSLPVTKQDGEVISGGSVVINRGGTLYTAQTQIPGNVNYVTMIRDTTGSVTFNSPGALATGDTIRLSFTYEP